MSDVAIIDYGMGNVHSVQKALIKIILANFTNLGNNLSKKNGEQLPLT